jgi:hypothetical protein
MFDLADYKNTTFSLLSEPFVRNKSSGRSAEAEVMLRLVVSLTASRNITGGKADRQS